VRQEEFSQKSDIWMFGVTVWEILTKGRCPNKKLLSLQRFKNELQKGRMPPKIPDGPLRSKELSLCFQFEVKVLKLLFLFCTIFLLFSCVSYFFFFIDLLSLMYRISFFVDLLSP